MTVPAGCLPAWLSERPDGCVVMVHVQPGARVAAVVGEHGDALKIRIDSPPVEGRANLALIMFLADRLGVPKSRLRLLSGDCSRRKRVLIEATRAADVERLLAI